MERNVLRGCGVQGDQVLANKTILIVDDEALFRSSICEGLKALDDSISVFEANDGLAALEVLETHDVDVVVSDLHMPGLDGVGLLTQMLNRAYRVPVVMVSAFRDEQNTAKATGMGAVSFLDKPVDYDELIEAVQRALDHNERAFMQGFSLASLLQLMNFDRKSSTLSVRSGAAAGHIFVSEGAVVDAWLGDEFGRSAFARTLRLDNPTLELSPLPDHVNRSITEPLSALLLDALRPDTERGRFVDIDDGWDEVVDATAFAELEREPNERENINMANVEQSLQKAMEINGSVGTALVDFESGMTLGTKGGGPNLDLEVAAAGNTEVVRAKMRVMQDLSIAGGIKDILITLEEQYHLIRPLEGTTLFMYLAIDSRTGNLAMARHKLAAIESELKV